MSHHKIHHSKSSDCETGPAEVTGFVTEGTRIVALPRAERKVNPRNHHLQERDGWWYFVAEFRGRRVRRATRTMEVTLARSLRDQWMEELWRDGMLRIEADEEAARPASLEAVLAAYQRGPMESKEETRRRTVLTVRQFLKRAGVPADASAAVTVLNDAAVAAFRDAVLREVAGESQARAAQVKASANSVLNQVAAVFSAEALDLFQRGNLLVPDAEGFRRACRLRAFSVPSALKRFVLPSEAVVRAILDGLPTLATMAPVQPPRVNALPPEVQRRNVARAVVLALGGGLRKGEIAQVRPGWIHATADGVRLETDAAEVKDQSGVLRQRVLRWVWERVGIAAEPGNSEFWICGTATEREELVFRRVSEWLRGLGWNAEKTNHGLRDLGISCVIAVTGSPYEGQVFARHSSVKVTEQHYGHFAREEWLKRLLPK